MKRHLVLVLLLINIVSLGLLLGCAQTTETTTTTTTSSTTTTSGTGTTTTTTSTTTTTNPLNQSAGQAAGKGASLANSALLGISNVAIGTGNINGISGNPQSQSLGVKTSDVKAFTIPVPPPSSFLISREASWDGYLTVPSIHAGETVSIRFSTVSGEVINGALLTASPQKRIAQFPTIDWIDFLTPEAVTTIIWGSNMSSWVPSPTYRNIYSMWDYIMWSSVAGEVHSYAEVVSHLSLPVFSTPESAVQANMIGSFQGTVSREVSPSNYGVELSFIGTMEYNTSIDPAHEVPKSLYGSGTITLPDNTAVALTMNLGFVTNEAQGTIPTTGTMHWSFTGYDSTWEGTVTLSYSSGAILGSGNVIKNGTDAGTLFLNSSGGAIVTVEGETINVTAPQ